MMMILAKVLLLYLIACFGTNTLYAESDDSDDCSVCGKGPSWFPPKLLFIGGKEIPCTKSFPWLVGIRQYDHTNLCAGAILDEYFILTAGHCITDDEGKLVKTVNLSVYFQTESKERLSEAAAIENMVLHPKYGLIVSDILLGEFAKYDIALIKLKEKIKCNKYRRSICLPETQKKVPTGEIFYVAGFCRPDSLGTGILQYGTLRSLMFDACMQNPCTQNVTNIEELKNHTLCLGGTKDPVCSSDNVDEKKCPANI